MIMLCHREITGMNYREQKACICRNQKKHVSYEYRNKLAGLGQKEPCVLLRFILQVAISVCICRHEDSEVKIYRREQSEKSTNQRQTFLAMCIPA